MDFLGKTVRDKITGFKGVVMGQVEYLTGCNQVLVSPPVKSDGSFAEPGWFDEQRVEVDAGVTRITLDNGKTPGFDKAPPIR